jgi:hypothetical protein
MLNIVYGLKSLALIEGETEILVGIDHINEMVRDKSLFLFGGLGGADVHIAVDLAAVGADYLAVEGLANLKG